MKLEKSKQELIYSFLKIQYKLSKWLCEKGHRWDLNLEPLTPKLISYPLSHISNLYYNYLVYWFKVDFFPSLSKNRQFCLFSDQFQPFFGKNCDWIIKWNNRYISFDAGSRDGEPTARGKSQVRILMAPIIIIFPI